VLSIDTNILFPAVAPSHVKHTKAARFLNELADEPDIVLSEYILLELYVLLRNPVVMPSPLNAGAAVAVCQSFRSHPKWQVTGVPANGAAFYNDFWTRLAKEPMARRRAYDCRAGLALIAFGVTEFATENVKDFEGIGFSRVWNPIA
jgi:predicted nucleic acid-binding protein